MAYKYIPNNVNKITHSVDYNKCLKCLDTPLNEQTNQNLIKAPKVVKPIIRKDCYNTLGTLWNKKLNVSSLPDNKSYVQVLNMTTPFQ